MSPESIMYRKYTVESDCWSFGILLWEVLTYGKQPWYEFTNLEVIQNVTRGKLLSPPDNCPLEIYQIMLQCWQFKPMERSSISAIHESIRNLLNKYKINAKSSVLPLIATSTSNDIAMSSTIPMIVNEFYETSHLADNTNDNYTEEMIPADSAEEKNYLTLSC